MAGALPNNPLKPDPFWADARVFGQAAVSENIPTKRWVTRYGSLGGTCSFLRYEVNRIQDAFLDCVYVYACESDAYTGQHTGGRGFFVSVPLQENPDRIALYAVTNRHVIQKAGNNPIITINRQDGKREAFQTNTSDWTLHPNLNHVAVASSASAISIPTDSISSISIGLLPIRCFRVGPSRNSMTMNE